MSQYGSWSVKGVDDRARAVAKEKARMKGITLGDYINNLLLEGHSEAGPRDLTHPGPRPHIPAFAEPERPSPLDSLAQRIEAVEARSTLAITGIDQSVLGLLARLENTENSASAMAAEVERMIDELRETSESLQDKVGTLEANETGQQSLDAMKALEEALGKLATHVYEESRLTQDESTAMKGRVEGGFSELTDRLDGMEIKVDSTLADAAQRVEKAVEQAELRTEGAARHLSERFSNIESSVAAKLAKVEDVDVRMKSVEGDVSGAIASMESTVARIQDRLHRAEQTTDTALKALEGTFSALDQRIDQVAAFANPEHAANLRAELEQRFEHLAADLRADVEQSRQHLADEIERAAAGQSPELMGALESRLSTLEQHDLGSRVEALSEQMSGISDSVERRLDESEFRNAAAIEQVGEQVTTLSETVRDRLTENDQRNADAIHQIGSQVADLSDSLNQRMLDSERRSAAAIEQVGEQVATAIKHVQARQEQGQEQLADRVAKSEARQEARLSDALGNVSDRLADMQNQTVNAMSPVQKAILSLAARLEAVEDFNAPPMSESASEPLPVMPELEVDATPIDVPAPAETDATDYPEVLESIAEEGAARDLDEMPTAEADFIAGLPDFDDTPESADDFGAPDATESWFDSEDETPPRFEPESDLSPDPVAEDIEDPFFDEHPDVDGVEYAASENESADADDPLAELGSWDESQHEARDSDVFSGDDESGMDVELLPELEEPEPLAHNTDLDEEDEYDPTEAEAEPTADYLSRAREAAIAAASDPKAEARAARRGRRSVASTSPKSPSGSKFPLIAAASAFALAAAGAGGWVALRGKIPFITAEQPPIVTKSDLAATPSDATTEPSLSGVEFAEVATPTLEEALFEDEGSAAGLPDPEEALFDTAAPPNLPVIPEAQTLEDAAINGNAIAQFKWGESRLAAQDLAAGADFVGRAAEQGLPAAQYRLAKLHERGIGVPRDFTEARAWTERAANGGNVKAMHDLAVFYADGEGGAQSYAAAAEWFRKAADFGVVDSQYNLAVLYENGLGISPSQVEALYWYEIASANGDASAPGNVATLREALPLDQAQQAQRRASTWTISTQNAAANGNFGAQAWEQASRTQVEAVQTVLNGLGYDAGPADGLTGAGTRTAIRAFQADNGLATTGDIDADLVEALNRQAQGLAG